MKASRPILLCLFLLVLSFPTASLHAAGFAMSDNFTVLTPDWPSAGEARQYAEEILKNAELWRTAIAEEWLGQKLPPGVGQTTVNVSINTQQDAGLTWAKDDPRRRYHTLYMSTSPEAALGGILAHEIVHVVLATRFPHPNRLPAWVEEGIACRYDEDDRQEIRQQQIAWIVQTKNWPELDSILTVTNIASRDKQAYAIAASLVEFLLSLNGDKQMLLEFGQYGNKAGWDAALRKYYDLRDVNQLQSHWQQWLAQ